MAHESRGPVGKMNTTSPHPMNIGVIILGNRESLRNPRLLSVHPAPKFVSPVYLSADYRPSLRQLFLEFILNGKFLTNGERGCSLAHQNIRNQILNSSHEWTLVLEDDAGVSDDWLEKVCREFPQFPNNVLPSLILFNSNPYIDIGPGAKPLHIRPSTTSSFLVHRAALEARSQIQLDPFQIADWPCSFALTQFWIMSNISFDLKLESTIGPRKTRRLMSVLSALIQGVMSPVFSRIAGVPLRIYLSWCVIGPLKRDLTLRWRNMVSRFAIQDKKS